MNPFARLRVRRGDRAGYGWTCRPCRIQEEQVDPFPTALEATEAFYRHVSEKHGGYKPKGARTCEIRHPGPGR